MEPKVNNLFYFKIIPNNGVPDLFVLDREADAHISYSTQIHPDINIEKITQSLD